MANDTAIGSVSHHVESGHLARNYVDVLSHKQEPVVFHRSLIAVQLTICGKQQPSTTGSWVAHPDNILSELATATFKVCEQSGYFHWREKLTMSLGLS